LGCIDQRPRGKGDKKAGNGAFDPDAAASAIRNGEPDIDASNHCQQGRGKGMGRGQRKK
jgi:hypothetical protein